jgi:hypothetical protein
VLSGLRTHLMEPKLFKEFCTEFTREVNRLRSERSADIEARRRELERVERELGKAIQAIVDGVPGTVLKDKIGALEARKAELTELLGGTTTLAASEYGGDLPATRGHSLRKPTDRGAKDRSRRALPDAGRSGDARARYGGTCHRAPWRPGCDPPFRRRQEKPRLPIGGRGS